MSDTTDDAARFDAVAKGRGSRGRLPAEAYPYPQSFFAGMKDWANGMAERQRQNLPFVRPVPQIIFDFADSEYLNAFASMDGDRLFMGVEAGAVTLLLDLFYRLLAEPSILKEVGNPALEVAGRNIYPVHGKQSALDAEWHKRGITLSDVVPRDLIRKRVAEAMATYATNFLVQHEFRHLIGGHRGYLDERASAGDDRPTLTNQALELDADTFATASGLMSVLHKVDRPKSWDASWRDIFPNHHLGLTLYFFALYALFRTDGPTQRERSVWEYDAYPPERTRAFLVFDRVFHFFVDWDRSDLVSHYGPASGRAISDAERGFALITGKPEDWGDISGAVGKDAHKHLVLIAQTWNEMGPEVEKHSYVRLEKTIIH